MIEQILDTLYKMDSTGKIRKWKISVGVEDNIPFYEVEHGISGGAMVSSRTKVPEGKNTSKKNATTAKEQCRQEATSLWLKQNQRKGYGTIIPSQMSFRPMLAKSFNNPGPDLHNLKDGNKIKFPCYFQPKLDGIRCIATKSKNPNNRVFLFSRQNKAFSSLPHIEEVLQNLTNFTSNLILDGELYVHGEEFQNLTSAIKRIEPSSDSAKIQYHIYDVYDESNPDWPYQDRMKWLSENIKLGFKKLKPVYTQEIKDISEVEKYLKEQIKRGYEGIMLRNKRGVYKINGRSADLQKVKLFIDQEFPIVDAYQNKGKMEEQCTFICQTDDGATFGVKPEGTDEQRRKYWDDWKDGKLKGALLTVRFFSWTTSKKPVPRFPVGIVIRDYEI